MEEVGQPLLAMWVRGEMGGVEIIGDGGDVVVIVVVK
jgi:hypothetical protein